MIDYRFDTQLLIENSKLYAEEISMYITDYIKGDSLLVIGDKDLIKIHYHTNEPWEVLEYCATLGDIHDIVIENMVRQANDLRG